MNQEILKHYIRGYATRAEMEEVAAWVKADKDHLKELLTLRKLYDVTVWQREKNTSSSDRRRKSMLLYKAGAAVAMVLFLLISKWYTYHINRKTPVKKNRPESFANKDGIKHILKVLRQKDNFLIRER
jgi:hypothetical protein